MSKPTGLRMPMAVKNHGAAGALLRQSGSSSALNWRICVGGGVLAILALAAILAPYIVPHDPLQTNTVLALSPPSGHFLLGNDEFGRDVFSRLIYGARASMSVSILSTILAVAAGTLAGVVGGYYGGVIDPVIMRSCDVLITIPPIVLAIAVVATLGPSLLNLILTISVLYVPAIARIAYTSTRVVSNLEYVQASLALGAPNAYLLRKAILPGIFAPLIIQGALTLSAAILVESGLSFLGLGVPPPTPTWGSMVSSARSVMESDPLLVVWPSLMLAIAILSFNILGDGVRDALDPRWRSLHRRGKT